MKSSETPRKRQNTMPRVVAAERVDTPRPRAARAILGPKRHRTSRLHPAAMLLAKQTRLLPLAEEVEGRRDGLRDSLLVCHLQPSSTHRQTPRPRRMLPKPSIRCANRRPRSHSQSLLSHRHHLLVLRPAKSVPRRRLERERQAKRIGPRSTRGILLTGNLSPSFTTLASTLIHPCQIP